MHNDQDIDSDLLAEASRSIVPFDLEGLSPERRAFVEWVIAAKSVPEPRPESSAPNPVDPPSVKAWFQR